MEFGDFFRLITHLMILFGLVCYIMSVSLFHSCKWQAEKMKNYVLLRGTKVNQNPQSEQKLLSL